jgi:hypothetical protein
MMCSPLWKAVFCCVVVQVLYVKTSTVDPKFQNVKGPANSNLSSSVLLLLLIKFLSSCYHIPLRYSSPPAIISLSSCYHIPLRYPSPPAIITLSAIPLPLLSYPSPLSLSSCYHISFRYPPHLLPYPSPLSSRSSCCLFPLLLPCHVCSLIHLHVSLSSSYQYSSPFVPCNSLLLL